MYGTKEDFAIGKQLVHDIDVREILIHEEIKVPNLFLSIR